MLKKIKRVSERERGGQGGGEREIEGEGGERGREGDGEMGLKRAQQQNGDSGMWQNGNINK